MNNLLIMLCLVASALSKSCVNCPSIVVPEIKAMAICELSGCDSGWSCRYIAEDTCDSCAGAVCELRSTWKSKDSKSTGSESASIWEASGDNLESNGSSSETTFETKGEDGSKSSGESSETSWQVYSKPLILVRRRELGVCLEENKLKL
jgi:hypothetical protein